MKERHSYIPHTPEEIKSMLETIGVPSIEELFSDVPKVFDFELALPKGSDEFSVYREMKSLAERNTNLEQLAVFRGGGIYHHYIPFVVQALASRSEFLTAYTPYQAEVSQGTLQALYEFQTMIVELTGMEVANSSMYDGATAVAEAALMAVRTNRKDKIIVAKNVHPEYREVIRTYCSGQNIKVEEVNFDKNSGNIDLETLKSKLTDDVSGVIVGYPNFFGVIEDLKIIRELLPEKVMFIVVANPIALSLLEAPGKLGADIVVGEGQPLGNPPNFGGPGFGFFATLEKYIRKMPGRIIGETKDTEGRTGYVMVLQTREQHIRRSKATSNICSNHAHNAVTAAIYMSVMGKEGLREVAEQSFAKAHSLKERLLKLEGVTEVFSGPFFHEFVISFNKDVEFINSELMKHKILGPLNLEKWYPEMKSCALFCTTEAVRNADIEFLLGRLEEIL
ncbi:MULTISPECIES: aminomethyl-transferring glycine dehydrogenase subunit GcvPA [Kosmotoga]|uniref:Probable glycine dehydrogenase (decarboxylating) subunit 1 n=1 Tax=Kosmotoga olearia (strain ATCC BAA-1733 / DSM 21960 / TBF 19.5.1) TaxID=521045 RepID=C5CF45_KOSOT|nr:MULTISPECIES: aminomethyl-transferring glycine dehydrogenase subunit GcvPA [Kosmotoga]ACR80310.1 Glycine dehydrogenase (decarboxylating) [Kosmotoga olearia TBF 19.5.1]MDK2953043.1 glycine dehydrogenase subunit 1 [Kosmotoga sp.]